MAQPTRPQHAFDIQRCVLKMHLSTSKAISQALSLMVVIALILIAGFGIYFSAIGVNLTGISPGGSKIPSSTPSKSTSFVTTTNPSAGGEYRVTFNQIAACKAFPPAFWGIPWAVTIDNTTEVQPPGTPLPLDNQGPVQGTYDPAFSNITFDLPDGTYSYVVSPTSEFFDPDSGNVTVAGSNVAVPIQYSGTACTETLTTSQSANTSTVPNATTSTISSSSISSPCSTTFQNGLNPPINLKLELKKNTSLQVCVMYYYYNDSATDTLNFSNWQQLIGISSWLENHAINSSGNFTVTPSIASAILGGPNNVGEGTSVVYTITPKVYGNWTYGFSFGWLYHSEEACGQDFLLSTGNGMSYPFSGCTAPLSSQYPVNSQGFVNGFLFAEIVGVSNSTQ